MRSPIGPFSRTSPYGSTVIVAPAAITPATAPIITIFFISFPFRHFQFSIFNFSFAYRMYLSAKSMYLFQSNSVSLCLPSRMW